MRALVTATWRVTLLTVKEPELVRGVERYWQFIVRLTSTHSLGSGTHLIERGFTVKFSEVACVEQRIGAGLLIAPQLSFCGLNVTQTKASMKQCLYRI